MYELCSTSCGHLATFAGYRIFTSMWRDERGEDWGKPHCPHAVGFSSISSSIYYIIYIDIILFASFLRIHLNIFHACWLLPLQTLKPTVLRLLLKMWGSDPRPFLWFWCCLGDTGWSGLTWFNASHARRRPRFWADFGEKWHEDSRLCTSGWWIPWTLLQWRLLQPRTARENTSNFYFLSDECVRISRILSDLPWTSFLFFCP